MDYPFGGYTLLRGIDDIALNMVLENLSFEFGAWADLTRYLLFLEDSYGWRL